MSRAGGSLRVAVVSGGMSSEAEVSRASGAQVLTALRRLGHHAAVVECDAELWATLRAGGYDCAFLALHGRFGEDGTVQGVCELLGIAYTGSPVTASCIAFDKATAKQVMAGAGLRTPPFLMVSRDLDAATAEAALAATAGRLGLPLVVKPNRSGSTIGLAIVRDRADLKTAYDAAAWHDDVMCETFVAGTEVTVGVLGHNPPEALPTLEIVSHRPLYDYQAKYEAGQSEHVIPARLSDAQNLAVQDAAVRAHRALGCRGVTRVDVIVDADGTPWVLEVNTIPGLTPLSLLPDAARAAGISFDELCDRLVRDAVSRHAVESPR